MRIDNPTADQIKPGDKVFWKEFVVDRVSGFEVYDNNGKWGSTDDIAYIEREDTLEVGDEIEWTIISTFRVKVVAVAVGHYMVQFEDKNCACYTMDYLKQHNFKITKKAKSMTAESPTAVLVVGVLLILWIGGFVLLDPRNHRWFK